MPSVWRRPSVLPIDWLSQARLDALQFTPAHEEKCFNSIHGGAGYRWQHAQVYRGYVLCLVTTGDSGGYVYLVVSPYYERHHPIIGFNFDEVSAVAEAKAKVDAQSPVGYQWTRAEIYRGHVVCSVEVDDSGGWTYLIVSPHYHQDFPIVGVNAKATTALACATVQIDERYEKRALQDYLLKHPEAQFLDDGAIARLAGIPPHELHPRGRSGRPFRPVHLERQLPTDVYFNDGP